jgi:AbrB family looped-hinge helix DNA binding protein
MVKKQLEKATKCCETNPVSKETSCCSVDAIISIDGRGQIVLPKDLREKAAINAGDKFTVISWKSGEKVCCISLIKAEAFADTVKNMLGPMLGEIVKQYRASQNSEF